MAAAGDAKQTSGDLDFRLDPWIPGRPRIWPNQRPPVGSASLEVSIVPRSLFVVMGEFVGEALLSWIPHGGVAALGGATRLGAA